MVLLTHKGHLEITFSFSNASWDKFVLFVCKQDTNRAAIRKRSVKLWGKVGNADS